MKIKVSKILDSTFARATFDLSRGNIRHSYKDHLVLELLRSDSSMAYNTLTLSLSPQHISHIISEIELQMREYPTLEYQPIDEYLMEYRDSLMEQFTQTNKLSTIHLLLDILDDKTTATAEVLATHGITASLLQHQLVQLDKEEAWVSKMQPSPTSVETMIILPSEKPRQLMIERFSTDLNELARQGKIDPVIGREREIERTMQILSRRKKNNPVLVGEAGVGKSAIVEGLALKILSGDVPPPIQNSRILSLDISSLIAGTKYRGEFEERMQELTTELLSAKDIILFIDEIHTIIGAGATQGSLDVANILKPVLARGQIKIIGATTHDEYRASIEKDSALERRFQKLSIEPSDREHTLKILSHIAPYYESHHNVKYSPESIEACVDLSSRYITDRTLPDKAIDLMDEAGASAQSISEQKRIERKDIELIVTSMLGIPAEQISQSEIERLRGMTDRLRSEVIGQDQAVEQVVKALQRARAGLRDEQRPIAVFMFIGPTGVGKTLLAKKIAQQMDRGDESLIRIDMSEYSLKHNLSRLIGSPPGYVGYGEGGELTEAVRRKPYSVVLLDEIEKAHPDIFNLLLQLLDEGRLTDGMGRLIDFRNTVIIMTSNLGSATSSKSARKIGYNTAQNNIDSEAEQANYKRALERFFKPEFLNRIDNVICFRSLDQDDIKRIVELELNHITKRIERAGYRLSISTEAIEQLTQECFDPKYGVRALRRVLTERVEDAVASQIIEGNLTLGDEIHIDKDGAKIIHRVA